MKKPFLILILFIFILAGCQPAPVQTRSVPFAWPVPALTQAEKDQLAQCDVFQLAKERYGSVSDEAGIASAYAPTTPCDWAVQANAYLENLDDGAATSEKAKQAYLNAVQSNPGFALAILGFPENYGVKTLVQPPPFAAEAITNLDINYSWGGLGTPVNYHITIDNTGSSPKVTVLEGDETLTTRTDWQVKSETINAIGPSLTDLIPVTEVRDFIVCTDNGPSWQVKATFAGGSEALLSTRWNLFTIGGPWQAEINGSLYLQVSAASLSAIYNLVTELDLPIGEPAGMTCFQTDWIYDHVTP